MVPDHSQCTEVNATGFPSFVIEHRFADGILRLVRRS